MQTLAAAGVTESDDEFESPVDDELEDDMPPGVADLGDTISSLLLQKPESDEARRPAPSSGTFHSRQLPTLNRSVPNSLR